ncbi:MAG: GntR family transcriptional regulator [Acetivibrionales bacterium]|jgi:GntR family transcriptional regulator|nr:GntR family transcriptional regulator [Clostridiaceae bacterium]
MDIDYFKKTFQFIPDSNVPLYAQLASYIKIQIQAGVLKAGDKMITENSICTALNISRTTVRQAMNRLVEEGLLNRYRGKGSYIADQKLKRNINYMYNFSENIRDAGAVPTSIVLQHKLVDVDENTAELLQLPRGQSKAFLLKRLRCANSEPIILETTYIPSYLCPDIEKLDFSTISLYNTLSNNYSLNLYHAVETIEAIIIDSTDAKHLKCKPKGPGYRIERISYLDSGYVFEFTTSLTRADKCVFRLDLYKNSSANKNTVDFERQLNL